MRDNIQHLKILLPLLSFLLLFTFLACAPKRFHYNDNAEKTMALIWGEKKVIKKTADGSIVYEYKKALTQGKQYSGESGMGGTFKTSEADFTVYCVNQITVNEIGEIIRHRAFARHVEQRGPGLYSKPYEYQHADCDSINLLLKSTLTNDGSYY